MLSKPIADRVKQAREILFTNFDEDVQKRLKIHEEQAKTRKSEMQEYFWYLTKYVLTKNPSRKFAGNYHFDDESHSFSVSQNKINLLSRRNTQEEDCSSIYQLVGMHDQRSRQDTKATQECPHPNRKAKIYKPSSTLGQRVISEAKTLKTEKAHLVFDYSNYPRPITMLENLKGKICWMRIVELHTGGFEENTCLVLSAIDEDGNIIPEEIAKKLFKLGVVKQSVYHAPKNMNLLAQIVQDKSGKMIADVMQHNDAFLHEEMEKLDKWEDDKRKAHRCTA